jgi:hypothetical protein
MYPTETRKPGPANARIFRQNPALAGTGIERKTSGSDGSLWRRQGGADAEPEGVSCMNLGEAKIIVVPLKICQSPFSKRPRLDVPSLRSSPKTKIVRNAALASISAGS